MFSFEILLLKIEVIYKALFRLSQGQKNKCLSCSVFMMSEDFGVILGLGRLAPSSAPLSLLHFRLSENGWQGSLGPGLVGCSVVALLCSAQKGQSFPESVLQHGAHRVCSYWGAHQACPYCAVSLLRCTPGVSLLWCTPGISSLQPCSVSISFVNL